MRPQTQVAPRAVPALNLAIIFCSEASALGRWVRSSRLGDLVLSQRTVALKVLFKHIASNPKFLERFYREARLAGLLDHPYLVRGYSVGEDHGWHYFAMEYIKGQSLQKCLRQLGKLSLGDALHVTIRCAQALQYAHEQGLVHRYVIPENIFISRRDGEIKVADLGMVKLLDDDMGLTQTGHAVGTPWYMPMEQAKNAKDTDARCDIYALGCVFYACLTGQPPFTGRTLVDVIQAKEAGTFPPARRSNRSVPERVDLIIAKMAAKLPKYRYQSCQEVIADLEGLGLANSSLSFVPGGPPAIPEHMAGISPTDQTPLPAENDTWYVRFRQTDGTPIQQRLTAAEVLLLAQSPDFDSAAKASRHPKEGFRALATIKEFELVHSILARSHADRQTSHQRRLYEKIVEQQDHKDKPPLEIEKFQRWWRIGWLCALALAGILAFCLIGGLVVSGFRRFSGVAVAAGTLRVPFAP